LNAFYQGFAVGAVAGFFLFPCAFVLLHYFLVWKNRQ